MRKRATKVKLRLRMTGTIESDEGGEYRWQKMDRDPTTAELVAALQEEGVGEVVKVTDSGKRDWIDPVIRLVPNTLEYGESYLVVRIEGETP